MPLRPADLLFLPVLGDSGAETIALRYALAVLALACAALALRGRRGWLVLAAIAFVETALAFWAAALARPYGLFVDPDVTRRAAEVATARLPGEDGALSGEPRSRAAEVSLARAGVPADALIVLPTLLPLAVVPGIGLAIFLLWRRDEAAEAAALWLAFSTAEAAAARGEGFLPGLWAHPLASVGLLAVVVVVLASGRLPWPRLRAPAAVAGTLALALLPPAGSAPPFAQRALAAALEQGPWLLLGGYGLARGAPLPARCLALGGGLLYLAGPAAADSWAAHAALRLGLILAATRPLLALAERTARALVPARACARLQASPSRLGLAAVLLAAMPGGFVARWNPPALDPVADASRAPLSTNLMPGLHWLRAHAPPGVTCLASPDYAAHVAVIGRRRVLRAPDLWQPADDQRRRRAERMLVAGRELDLARRYQVGCVFFAVSDVGWLGTATGDALDAAGTLALGHADAYTRVYRVNGASPAR